MECIVRREKGKKKAERNRRLYFVSSILVAKESSLVDDKQSGRIQRQVNSALHRMLDG